MRRRSMYNDGSKNLNAALIRPHDAGNGPAANIDSHLPETLCELLALRAREDSNRIAYRYLESDVEAPAVITYQDLNARARELAAVLRSQNARGERAVLLYPAGLDFITALFACLYEGV